MRNFLQYFLISTIIFSCQDSDSNKFNNDEVVDDMASEHIQNTNKPNTEDHVSDLESIFNNLETGHEYPFSGFEENDSSFTIETDIGMMKFISNRDLEEDSVSFEFHGFNPSNNLYIIERHYWEGHEFILLDRSNQSTIEIWNTPIFTKDNKKLICKSDKPGYEWTPNGYQIWQLESNGQWVKTIEVNQNDWTPLSIRWVDNHKLILKKAPLKVYFENPDEIQTHSSYLEITTN